MTYQESALRMQQLAGNGDTPVFFSDRAFRAPFSRPVGTVADYLEQLAKNPPDDAATSISASGTACPVLDVVAGQTEDGRKCVIFEYDSVSAP